MKLIKKLLLGVRLERSKEHLTKVLNARKHLIVADLRTAHRALGDELKKRCEY